MLCEKCTPRELKAMRALESLTPGGSEYVNDVERCVAFVRGSRESLMRVLVKTKQEMNDLKDELRLIKEGI